jgi:hypothetical protein
LLRKNSFGLGVIKMRFDGIRGAYNEKLENQHYKA